MPEFLTTPEGRRIAYHRTPGTGPGILFCGGFRSDMQGSKAQYLEDRARAEGRAFLRFDYSGHGESDGAFTDGAIGDWKRDAAAVLEALTEGPQILVGSSMGGWISLLLARETPERVAGFVGIAAAPDFTEDGFWAGFTEAERAEIAAGRPVEIPSDYEAPYQITPRLIAEGRENLILRSPLPLPCAARFLLGTADTAVSVATTLRLLDHVEGSDIRLTLVKGADHRFSDPDCLALISEAIDDVTRRAG
ncbi:alpha/beta hydrolase [Falsigemmobacter faecalis]|uniref:Palmitoyl-protein thioesterase ABHD10, mitochondrial n=1 Tax=Falsigemmobacter faecalis TaxID=2488730 RepID=A0A3P3DGR4_9RHOB|nr:alpha/beta hydrolase [Falsigemmobacter faecalis]RRH73433.1 alpha/beta hydrolase [Falsigemmobacter faecalis]